MRAEEISKLIKSNQQDPSFNLKRTYEIIAQIDNNQDGRITKEEFSTYIVNE